MRTFFLRKHKARIYQRPVEFCWNSIKEYSVFPFETPYKTHIYTEKPSSSSSFWLILEKNLPRFDNLLSLWNKFTINLVIEIDSEWYSIQPITSWCHNIIINNFQNLPRFQNQYSSKISHFCFIPFSFIIFEFDLIYCKLPRHVTINFKKHNIPLNRTNSLLD